MGKRSASFGVVFHVPSDMNYTRLQQQFDDFYIAQVKKTLNASTLDRAGKVEVIDRLIARHAEAERSAESL